MNWVLQDVTRMQWSVSPSETSAQMQFIWCTLKKTDPLRTRSFQMENKIQLRFCRSEQPSRGKAKLWTPGKYEQNVLWSQVPSERQQLKSLFKRDFLSNDWKLFCISFLISLEIKAGPLVISMANFKRNSLNLDSPALLPKSKSHRKASIISQPSELDRQNWITLKPWIH